MPSIPGFGLPLGFAAVAAAVEVEDLGTLQDTGTAATGTFAFASYGTAATNRLLLGAYLMRDNATSFDISSGTINGVSFNTRFTGQTSNLYHVGIFGHTASGTLSGNVVITMDESIAQDKLCAIASMPEGALLTDKGAETNVTASGTTCVTGTNTAGSGGLNAGSFIFTAIAKGASTQGVTFTDDSGDAGTWVELDDLGNTDATARFAFAYKKLLTTIPTDINVTATGGATSVPWAMVVWSLGA